MQGQCKRNCDESSDCEAISFDDSGSTSTCELRSSANYDDCEELGVDPTGVIYM